MTHTSPEYGGPHRRKAGAARRKKRSFWRRLRRRLHAWLRAVLAHP